MVPIREENPFFAQIALFLTPVYMVPIREENLPTCLELSYNNTGLYGPYKGGKFYMLVILLNLQLVYMVPIRERI